MCGRPATRTGPGCRCGTRARTGPTHPGRPGRGGAGTEHRGRVRPRGRHHPGRGGRRRQCRGAPGGHIGQRAGGLRHAGPGHRIGREQPHQHRRERSGPAGRGYLAAGHRVQDGQRVVSLTERGRALHGRVQRRAEREDVRRGRGILPPRHLGREVGGGTGEKPGRRHRDVADRPRDAEIGDLHGAVADQQVRRLHVPVHDPGGMRGGQRGGGLRADVGHLMRRQRAPARDLGGQTRRGHVLHHQPRLAVLLGHIEDGDGVRMVQPGGDAALAHGTLLRILRLLPGETRRQQQLLDRDHPLQSLVGGAPHHAHRAGADPLGQPIPSSDQPVRRHVVVPLLPSLTAPPRRPVDDRKADAPKCFAPGPWDERHPPTAPDAVATLRQWHTPPTDIHPRRAARSGRRGPAHNAVAALPPPAAHALKYLASGCRSTNASVDCSGCSCSSSESTTPIRSASSRSTSLARSSRSGHAP